jgi:hypothetical protein
MLSLQYSPPNQRRKERNYSNDPKNRQFFV